MDDLRAADAAKPNLEGIRTGLRVNSGKLIAPGEARRIWSPTRPCPQDKVNRKFKANAPDQLRVADFTSVHTAMGMACAAFVIDVFARKTVEWRVSTSTTTSFVLDALFNQAIRQRRPVPGALAHHSD